MARWILPLAVLIVPISLAEAATVRWTATGTVTSARGTNLGPLASVDDAVQIEFSYEDGAPEVAITDIPQLGWTEKEYREGVDLRIRITIGANTWEGTIDTGSETAPRTLEVRNTSIGPTDSASTDRFIARTAFADGATFPSFPGVAPGNSTKLELEFEDGSETAEGADYLGSALLPCVSQSITRITEATGVVWNGALDAIRFSIDPASIRTELVGVNVLPITKISVDLAAEEVTITWPTQPGFFYIIQYLDEFLCWREHVSVFALEDETTETFFPAGIPFPTGQLYRIIEEE